ncbi:MAG: molybdopterin molybdotransferase MoeA [Chloroflexi bacterium]|nr:molybdopterin molybdotransferase MoeA [Chloroflexota bacterium]
MPETLLSVAEARVRLLAEFAPLEAESALLQDAPGRVLAQDVASPTDLPPFDNSSMDGYALRAAEIALAGEATPVPLPVLADIPAGAPAAGPLAPGAAARIMTGAPLPPGADTVVPVELTDDPRRDAGSRPPAVIRILAALERGANVRRAGEDLRAGETVLLAGTVIRAKEVGLLAALGMARVAVVRRPRVAVLSTGDELAGVDESLTPGKIRDVNGYTLPALVARYGGEVIPLGVARDTVAEVTERLDRAVALRADLLLSSAGVSVGAFDCVKEAVERQGEIGFWRVNMRPGKPVAFGRYRGAPFLGLPGNPVSALVSFEVFARPPILRMGGRRRLDKPCVSARLAEPVTSDGRESYLRVIVERQGAGYVAQLAGGQGSAMFSSLVRANALLIVPAGVTQVPAGSALPAWMLDWPEAVE